MVVCDEPITALDVSIQGQIVNLLKDLQRADGLTYLFVAHDLLMVKYISDRVGVMYLGRLVEIAPKAELFAHPLHPYTQALLSSVPIPDPARERARVELTPERRAAEPLERIPGCAFRDRCPHAREACPHPGRADTGRPRPPRDVHPARHAITLVSVGWWHPRYERTRFVGDGLSF